MWPVSVWLPDKNAAGEVGSQRRGERWEDLRMDGQAGPAADCLTGAASAGRREDVTRLVVRPLPL